MYNDIYIQEFEREVFREIYGSGARNGVVSFIDPSAVDGRIGRIVSRIARDGTVKWIVTNETEKNNTMTSGGFQFQCVRISDLNGHSDLIVMSQALLDYAVRASSVTHIVGTIGRRGVILVTGIPSQAEASQDLLLLPGSVCYCSTPVSGRGNYLNVVYRASGGIHTNSWDRLMLLVPPTRSFTNSTKTKGQNGTYS